MRSFAEAAQQKRPSPFSNQLLRFAQHHAVDRDDSRIGKQTRTSICVAADHISGEGEINEVTILGRTVRWTDEGIEYEADAEHRAKLMKAEGLEEDSKVAVGPAVKDGGDAKALEEVKLERAWEHKEF